MVSIKLCSLVAVTINLLGISTSQQWFPKYHLSPLKGWMNDPNGLIYHKGYYHAFWQYNPYDIKPALIHWGHARSKNMLNWEHLSVALAPSLPDDIDGVFSGSAVIKDDKIHLMYTGVSKGNTIQRQMLAVSENDIDFKKLGVVIVKNGSELNFRDPKVWQQDGSYWVIIGSQTPEPRGEVLLYKSPNLYNWTFDRVLAQSNEKLGYMWECPDFITLGGKQLLIVNPQGMEQQGYDYQNLYQTGYFVGSWKPGTDYTIEKGFREIDHGHDFYASQTFLAEDGRRILIGWLDMWEAQFAENVEGWSGMLTLPRELTLTQSGDLEVRPIKEVKEIRTKRKVANILPINTNEDQDKVMMGGKDLYKNEIRIDFNLSSTTCQEFGIQIKGSDNDMEGVKVYVDRSKSRLFLERYYPQYEIEKSNRSIPLNLNDDVVALDVFLDSSSIEVFVNDGQAVMSSRIYPNPDQREFSIYGRNGSLAMSNFSIWDL